MNVNTIICGAMPEATKGFPDGSINCCISSPPYWALRDYGVDGQLGLEKTFEEYIDKLCTIYDEIKRVLRDDGTCWVNLGDTYMNNSSLQGAGGAGFGNDKIGMIYKSSPIIQEKSLSMIPQRFAQAMIEPILRCRGKGCRKEVPYRKWNTMDTQNGKRLSCPICGHISTDEPEIAHRGWILRNVIIWHKPNPMPSSAKDRFTVDFEYVYFFVKSRKYWFEPQYEPHQSDTRTGRIINGKESNQRYSKAEADSVATGSRMGNSPLGRNKRTVWTIPTQPFPEAHFATFPEKLVEPMIKAGCPEFVCTKCGKAREKIYEPTMIIKRDQTYDGKQQGQDKQFSHKRIQMLVKAGREAGLPHDNTVVPKIFKGYTDCGCNADWRPGVTLDCFLRLWHDFTGSRQVAA